ncbi:MAG: hypothetical protein CL489_06960 [Acidobacteria bacterium]|nr:hypothetical protein [Acidobacteriota bacterium]
MNVSEHMFENLRAWRSVFVSSDNLAAGAQLEARCGDEVFECVVIREALGFGRRAVLIRRVSECSE